VRRRCHIAAIVLAAALCPGALRAQYRCEPTDTLRYRRAYRTTDEFVSPPGMRPSWTSKDATIAIAFRGGDTATVWYEALSSAYPGRSYEGDASVDTVLARPWTLRFDPRGRVRGLSGPQFPDYVLEPDIDFTDFFLLLPADFDLAMGRTWSDTVTSGGSGKEQRILSFKVLGDTNIAGDSAIVIGANQVIRSTGTGPYPGHPGVIEHSEVAGADSGFFIFSTRRGRMLAARRRGRLDITTSFEGSALSSMLVARHTYIEAIDPAP